MELPDGLMPCLSSSAVNAFSESTSVSKAASQLALPLATTTFFASSLISWPNGSAVCTFAAGGVCAAAGGGAGEGGAPGAGEGGAGLALGAGDGLAESSGDGVGEGACASVWPAPNASATGANAVRARRNLRKFIRY